MSGDADITAGNPLGFKINTTSLPAGGFPVELRPDSQARAALAQINGIVAVEDFVAELMVRRWHKDGVRVVGEIHASIVQNCGVTLDPVSQTMDTQVDAVFVPENSRLSHRLEAGDTLEMFIDPEGDDPPEPFQPPWLDVGDIAQEFFALAIDPWPRAPGVSQADAVQDRENDDEGRRENPFTALEAIRRKL